MKKLMSDSSFYAIFPYRFPEAWPTGPGVELGVGVEERVSAHNAFIDALFVTIPVLSCKGNLCALVNADVVLLRCKTELELCFFFL